MLENNKNWLLARSLWVALCPDKRDRLGAVILRAAEHEPHEEAKAIKALSKALKAGGDPDYCDNFGGDCSALHRAARRGNIAAMEMLILAGANVEARDLNENVPLHHAVEAKQDEAVRVLIEAGADVDSALGVKRDTPLHIAAARDSLSACVALIGAGAKMLKNHRGFYPLHLSIKASDELALCLVNEGGADPRALDDQGLTAADRARTAEESSAGLHARLLFAAQAGNEAREIGESLNEAGRAQAEAFSPERSKLRI